MAWQDVPFLIPTLNDVLGATSLNNQPLKVMVEMTPSAPSENTALWAALIGAFVSALIAFCTQFINSKNQNAERSHQTSLLIYQTSISIKQSWANDLINESAAYISFSTATHNIHNNMLLLIHEGKGETEKFTNLHKSILDKKESLGRVKAKIDMLLGDKKDDESQKIIVALEDIRRYFGGFKEIHNGLIDLDQLKPYFEIITVNVRIVIDREIKSVSPS
ncbi:hypothetical protein [Enterobacter roggenkampii]|uniref:hypothetical protein n=1 Tax=Enterobacter roggenkampii TaxID=1812935 RepID=UPI0021D04981|nr:hypothetical protein [Enterobacter roggenkampii]MCU6164896.1 hypothetical protein [Enterobacter roggenkampii]